MDHEEDFERFEEGQFLGLITFSIKCSECRDTPIVGQIFSRWKELDQFISLYARSQNFASVIRGSEYSEDVCRNRRYACEHQGHNVVKTKTNIVKNQQQTRSKRSGCR
ncbi:18985_t:CDS:2, partial [Gigaspora rosea]